MNIKQVKCTTSKPTSVIIFVLYSCVKKINKLCLNKNKLISTGKCKVSSLVIVEDNYIKLHKDSKEGDKHFIFIFLNTSAKQK